MKLTRFLSIRTFLNRLQHPRAEVKVFIKGVLLRLIAKILAPVFLVLVGLGIFAFTPLVGENAIIFKIFFFITAGAVVFAGIMVYAFWRSISRTISRFVPDSFGEARYEDEDKRIYDV